MDWWLSWCADPRAVKLANRHYSRQSPGSNQFMPPGRKLVLLTDEATAVWGTSWPLPQYVKRAWKGAWLCSIFRNESPALSSELIRQAIAATRWYWPQVPAEGMVTMVDARKVRHKRDVGRCFRRAGFRHVGYTAGGLHVLQLLPEDMPDAEAPNGAQLRLFA